MQNNFMNLDRGQCFYIAPFMERHLKYRENQIIIIDVIYSSLADQINPSTKCLMYCNLSTVNVINVVPVDSEGKKEP